MNQAPHACLQFDRFTLDPARAALRFDNQEIFPRPKAFHVLCHLARNAGRLVGKEELFAAVWPEVEVTDDSLVQCIRELRQLLGDEEHRLIKTVSRRGYLLDADVTVPPPILQPVAPIALPVEGSAASAAPSYARSRHFTPAPLPSSA